MIASLIQPLHPCVCRSGEQEPTQSKKGATKTFTDIANEAFGSEELKKSGLTFDVSQFKAKKEVQH